MKFASTRNIGHEVRLKDAIFEGLAPDGGLYMPTTEPDLSGIFRDCGPEVSFQDLSARIMHGLFGGEFDEATCKDLCHRAFPFEPVIREISDHLYDVELFHGPSCAFKDYGASFLATMMEHFLSRSRQRAVILTATSGDTGSAVAQAFHGKEGIDVVILYPSGRVSPSQEMQLTTVGGNVHALEVKGSFDDCQRMVKEAFLDPGLRMRFPLSSANSINLGRLIPQSFYYAYTFTKMKKKNHGEFWFTVPSGNFGNLTAGTLAWRWGLPVNGFIAATNANDVVPEYLSSGIFKARPSVLTPANAMDVGNPSNFERLQALFNMDWTRMRTIIHGEVVNDADIMATMKRYDRDHGVVLCPHTAVGVLASERFRDRELEGAGVIMNLATAHPGKFSEVVREACGHDPEVPERLAEYMRREKKADMLGNSLSDLTAWLDSHIQKR